jgi:hypothetical protein
MGPETESPSRGDQNRPLNLGNIVTRRRRSSVEELFYKESWGIVSVEAVGICYVYGTTWRALHTKAGDPSSANSEELSYVGS